MAPQNRWARAPITVLALISITAVLAACAGGGAPATAGTSAAAEVPSAPAETEAAASTPAPTDLLEMSIALLPTPSFDPATVDVSCDEASLGAAAAMACDEIVALAARVASTVSAKPITELAVTAAADNPDAIQITFWVPVEEGSGVTAFTSVINPANGTVTFPMEDPEAVPPA